MILSKPIDLNKLVFSSFLLYESKVISEAQASLIENCKSLGKYLQLLLKSDTLSLILVKSTNLFYQRSKIIISRKCMSALP